MLLPDNIKPEYTLFYVGFLILKELRNLNSISLFDLYQRIKVEHDISFSLYSLSLDWLYLIEAAKVNDVGDVQLCI